MENQPAVGFPLPFPPMRCSFRGISHEVQTEYKNAGGVFDERAWRAKVFRSLRRAIKTKVKLISPCGGRGNQKGIPPSADGGQHTHFIRARRGNKDSGLRAARLDRAGSQTRTRLSPAGGTRGFFRFTAKIPSRHTAFHHKYDLPSRYSRPRRWSSHTQVQARCE